MSSSYKDIDIKMENGKLLCVSGLWYGAEAQYLTKSTMNKFNAFEMTLTIQMHVEISRRDKVRRSFRTMKKETGAYNKIILMK